MKPSWMLIKKRCPKDGKEMLLIAEGEAVWICPTCGKRIKANGRRGKNSNS